MFLLLLLSVACVDDAFIDTSHEDPCRPGERLARLNEDGSFSPPLGAEEIEYEDVELDTGFIEDLYGDAYDTTTDAWLAAYGDNCEVSYGGELPEGLSEVNPGEDYEDAPGLADYGMTLSAEELDAAIQDGARPVAERLLAELRSPDRAWWADEAYLDLPGAQSATPCVDCLDEASPFEGRDIIYVHGALKSALWASVNPLGDELADAIWPTDASSFLESDGYWRQKSEENWSAHVERYLLDATYDGQPAANRYMVVSYPTTQRITVGVHALLYQVGQAMNTGERVELLDPRDPRGTSGFCEDGCVIISHSTGGPVVDVAMTLAAESGEGQELPWDVRYIPEHMQVHVGLQGAFSGSPLAELAVASEQENLPPDVAYAECFLLLSGLEVGEDEELMELCESLWTDDSWWPLFSDTALADLVPMVTQGFWGEYIRRTPVPTLVAAGGHPSAGTPLKHLLLPGLDDKLLNMDSQCATLAPAENWPSGYVAKGSTQVYDMGVDARRAAGLWLSQEADLRGKNGSDLTAASCSTYLSPTGMVQPVRALAANNGLRPDNRYPNHYSFIQAPADHFSVATGKLGIGSDYGDAWLTDTTYQESWGAESWEEVPAVTDADVYKLRGGTPLLNPGFQRLPRQRVRGRRVRFRVPFFGTYTWWVWRRQYVILDGSRQLDMGDYIYRYVSRS